MPRVFIFGASGFIGNAVARAFAVRGYNVTALVRTEEKAKLLRRQEITPLLGQAQDTKVWEAVAASSDIIIEAFIDYQDPSSAVTVQKAILDILHKHKDKTVIYTSGVWVAGNTTARTDESSPLNPPDLVKGRPPAEKAYIDAGAIVLRPGCVYGHEGSLTGMLFGGLKAGKGEFPGFENNEPRWAMVHVDDLADAYVRTAERAHSLRGQSLFLITYTERVRDVLQSIAKLIGYNGIIKFVEPKDPFSLCLALSQKHLDNSKAKLLLDWNPKHSHLVADIERYYKAWEAFQP